MYISRKCAVKIYNKALRILTAALAQANFLLSNIMEGRHDSLHLMLRWPDGPGILHYDKKPQWVKSFLKQHSHFHFRDLFSKNIMQYQKSVRIYLKRIYHTRAIISCGLYIFYPIFKDHFFVFKEIFSKTFWKIESPNAISWIQLGGMAKKIFF